MVQDNSREGSVSRSVSESINACLKAKGGGREDNCGNKETQPLTMASKNTGFHSMYFSDVSRWQRTCRDFSFGDKHHLQKQEGREAERLFNFFLFATETPNLWILAGRVRSAKLATFQD